MAYEEEFADRIRAALRGRMGFAERKMFGGVGFLLSGNMCVGIWKENLILRIGPEEYAGFLTRPHVKLFDITGRPMAGWIMVEPGGFTDAKALARWIDHAVNYVKVLPAKKNK